MNKHFLLIGCSKKYKKPLFCPLFLLLMAGVLISVPFCLQAADRLWGKYLYDIPLDTCLSEVTMPIDETQCILSDPSHSLVSFFEELHRLRDGQDTVINIVHLGDSHIQAGYYSGQVMRLLHNEFGNAGRGWIAPFRLSHVNGPSDYFISSSVKNWEAGRAIQSTPAVPVGVGGIGISTTASKIDFDVTIPAVNGAGYGFNQAVLYRERDALPLWPGGPDNETAATSFGQTIHAMHVLADTFALAGLTHTLHLQGNGKRPASGESIYYGLNLTNGNAGVLYHSIGVNGSMFVNYTDPEYICQLALLRPSLLIVSLGTNETFGSRFSAEEFAAQVHRFLALVREQLPGTAVLLTTPPECWKASRANRRTTYTRNANTELAAHTLMAVAQEEGVACWDLFTATGGKNSSRQWHANQLMGKDRVHFTREGYEQQGTLLYYALMRAYNDQYVESRLTSYLQAAFIQTNILSLLSISYLQRPSLLFSTIRANGRRDDSDNPDSKSVPTHQSRAAGSILW